MKLQYVAEDGTIFNNEDDCVDYENNLLVNKEFVGCIFYNGNAENLPLTCDIIEEIWYVHFETVEQLEKFQELSNRLGISIEGLEDIDLTRPLNFYYDENYPQGFKQYCLVIDDMFNKIQDLKAEEHKLFYEN